MVRTRAQTRSRPVARIGFLGDGNPLSKDVTASEYLRFYGQCFRMNGKALEHAIAETLATFDLEGKSASAC